MKRNISQTSITSRFLLFTLPPMILVAIALLAVLAWANIQNIQQQETTTTEEIAVRYARILSRPMWNLEANTTQDVLASLMEEDDINCLILSDQSDLYNRATQGKCLNKGESSSEYEADILFLHNNFLELIGTLYIQRQSTKIAAKMFHILFPQIIVALFTFILLVFFVIVGFRRSVLRPLSAIHQSIALFEESGTRRKVAWDSEDELGQLIHAYNASLNQQDTIESEIRDQLALTNSLLNTIPQPISFLSMDKTFLRCNESFKQLFNLGSGPITGMSPSQILGNNPWQLLPDQLDQFFSSSGKVFSRETTITTRKGETLDIIFSSGALRDASGKIDGIVSILQDITDRKFIETEMVSAKNSAETAFDELRVAQENLIQSEKMASLGSLVAGVSHEINTPLGSSITVASAIQERTLDLNESLSKGLIRKSMLEEYVELMMTACKILNNSLLSAADLVQSFKQVAVDQTSSKRRTFDLDTSLNEVLSTVQPTFKKSKITLKSDLNIDETLNSYPGPLGQVITNIVHNALIHAFEDRETGSVMISSHMVDETSVKIIIRDDGLGIAEENISRIFDPFFTTRMGQGGTGLGLNVVYNIVKTLLGGTIDVQSELNEGTVFTIIIPKRAPVKASKNPDFDEE